MPAVAIVQARMGSSRLPGKVLLDIAGKPTLERVLDRVIRAKSVDRSMVATTRDSTDDAIAMFCRLRNIPCFRGSDTDVLDRFYWAASRIGATEVVRVTADCPLVDPEVIDLVVMQVRDGVADYASNTLVASYPDGLDV